jgi:hypothetical protein
MLLVPNLRNSSGGLVPHRAVLVCAAIFALLLARTAPPEFQRTHALRSTVNCGTSHEKKPCFDQDGSQCVTPTNTILPSPPPVVSSRLTQSSEPFIEITLHGLHYNRPPPVT